MGTDQKCNVKWNHHRDAVLQEFESLFRSNSLVDCSIGAEGKYLNAHKILLSTCSPYLRDVFSEHFDKHTVLVLKDVSFEELKGIIDYIYSGEVNISYDKLPSFLKAAGLLKVKGLTDGFNNYNVITGNYPLNSSLSDNNVTVRDVAIQKNTLLTPTGNVLLSEDNSVNAAPSERKKKTSACTSHADEIESSQSTAKSNALAVNNCFVSLHRTCDEKCNRKGWNITETETFANHAHDVDSFEMKDEPIERTVKTELFEVDTEDLISAESFENISFENQSFNNENPHNSVQLFQPSVVSIRSVEEKVTDVIVYPQDNFERNSDHTHDKNSNIAYSSTREEKVEEPTDSHGTGSQSRKRYSCCHIGCNRYFSYFSIWRHHHTMKHASEPYECANEECQKLYSVSFQLKQPLYEVLQEETSDDSSNGACKMDWNALSQAPYKSKNQFVCRYCGKVLNSTLDKRRHIAKKHHEKLKLVCNGCARLYDTKMSLNYHLRTCTILKASGQDQRERIQGILNKPEKELKLYFDSTVLNKRRLALKKGIPLKVLDYQLGIRKHR